MNPHENAARLHKALRLANWLEANCPRTMTLDRDGDFSVLLTMTNHWWIAVANAAGVTFPSSPTKRLVVSILRDRAQPDETLAEIFGARA